MNTTGPATEAHALHMETMKRLRTRQERAEYVEGVKRAEGAFAAKWLRDDFAAWWSSQQRAKEQA